MTYYKLIKFIIKSRKAGWKTGFLNPKFHFKLINRYTIKDLQMKGFFSGRPGLCLGEKCSGNRKGKKLKEKSRSAKKFYSRTFFEIREILFLIFLSFLGDDMGT